MKKIHLMTGKLSFLYEKHNEMMERAHYANLKRDSAAEMDYLKSADRLYKAICNAEERLRKAGAEVRRTDGDYPWYHITVATVKVGGRLIAAYPAAEEPEAPHGDATDEERIDALFHELVPVEGKADTVAGEIVRAVCRIGYRYNNDGDYLGCGYGKETCNPAARYLMANAGEDVAEIVRCLWAAGEECGVLDDGSYGDWLSELVKAALTYLDAHPELKMTPNAEDYWNYRDPVEDVDEWDDEDEDDWDAA